jgi:hypothetical protein
MEFLEQRLAPTDSLKAALLLSGIVTATLSVAVGGTGIVLVAIATVLALYINQVPGAAIVAGPMFLLWANVLLPTAARFDPTGVVPAREMQYWAGGIFLITIVALRKLHWKMWFEVPRALQSFVLVAVAASIYGIIRGNDPSYVLRQLFGSLLLVAYFAFAQQFGSEKTLFQQFRNCAIPCVVVFLLYYVWISGEYGLHKEATTLGTQGATLAILFLARTGWKWRIASAILMLPAFLLVERRALLAFLLGMLLIHALRTKSLVRRVCLVSVSAVIVLFSLAPQFGGKALDAIMGVSSIERALPEGARDTISLQDRGLQLVGAVMVLQQSPVLGSGMGSQLLWRSATRGDLEQAYVDNGWAYLAVKMGLLGVASFLWFIFTVVKRIQGNSAALSACVLSMLLLVMFTEPVFFQFTTTPLLGVVLGLLYRGTPRVQIVEASVGFDR